MKVQLQVIRAAEQSDKDVYFPFSESAEELDNMTAPEWTQ
jgi:hypothetical protein